jgi:uncharacterized repeat protein (TIGR02543 family)
VRHSYEQFGGTTSDSPATKKTTVKITDAVYRAPATAVPKRTGYTFTGWYTAKDGGVQITDAAQANAVAVTESTDFPTTFYARWTVKTVSVTLNANGGDAVPGTTVTYAKTYGTGTLGALPTPVREGYVFKGWYTAGGSKVTASTKVSANTTYYAHWIKDWAY